MTRIGVVPKDGTGEKLQLHNLLHVFNIPTIALEIQQIEIQEYMLILVGNDWTLLSYL